MRAYELLEQSVVGGSLNEFAPNSDDGDDRDYEYEVYQCNPEDQFDRIGGPIYKSDDMGKVHGVAYELWKKYPDKAFMVWEERIQGSRGRYGPKDDEQSVTEGYSNTTFNIKRRKLNVPALIQKGAIFVTYPHGEQGWETDNKEDWGYSLISFYNVLKGGWPSEAKKYLKPESYKRAEQQINSSAPNLGSDQLVYDGKYNQILWSIKKLGIPDDVAFLDKDKQGVAETVNPAVFKQGFEKTKPILDGKYTLTAKNGRILYHQKPHEPSDQFRIEVKTDRGALVGWVNFENISDNLEALDLHVDARHRRKGIATEIYRFARELGNTIKPSSKQTAMGKAMWQGFNKTKP